MPIEGGDPVRIWEKSTAAGISPDGKWIRLIDQQRVMLIPAEGGEPVKAFDLNSEWDSLQGWTPDGKAFLYVKSINGIPNVWQRNMDGGEAKQLTCFDNELILSAAMSRDGKELAVIRYFFTNDVVLIKDLDVE
jgi:Tol biopolymer transport system component